MDKLMKSLREFWAKTRPFREKTGKVLKKAWEYLHKIGKMAYELRSIVLAIPVVVGAVILAIMNAAKLPAQVGINLLASGEYALMVNKLVAVTAPLLVTTVCVLLMFCSKRVAYPFLISLFSLALPVLILITNIFPA